MYVGAGQNLCECQFPCRPAMRAGSYIYIHTGPTNREQEQSQKIMRKLRHYLHSSHRVPHPPQPNPTHLMSISSLHRQPQVERRWLADLLGDEKAVVPLIKYLKNTGIGGREGAREKELEWEQRNDQAGENLIN